MAEDLTCATRYPLLLVHGAGFRDLKIPVYWGRIPAALKQRGAHIYYGEQDGWGSVETNARSIGERIDAILGENGCEKVNILAHSKGGLDARMAVSSLGYGCKVASLTTIATPHHGSQTLDRLFSLPRPVWNTAAFAVDNWIRLVGDKKPDFLELCRGLTTDAAEEFNRSNPDVPGVFYQSFACVMSRPLSDIHLSTANRILNRLEGPNDGLVSVTSAFWGTEWNILRSNGFRGISHLDAIDLRRAPLTRKKGENVSDICDVYVRIVRDLKQRGY